MAGGVGPQPLRPREARLDGDLGVQHPPVLHDRVQGEGGLGGGPAGAGGQVEGVPVPGADQAPVAQEAVDQRRLLVRAQRVGDDDAVAEVEDEVVAALVGHRPALPSSRGADRDLGGASHGYRHASSTEPSRSMVATTTSPGVTGTAAVRPPDRTTSPARSPSPEVDRERTSQATAAAGWPRVAAPDAVETTSPLCSSTTLTSRRSMPATGTGAPTTYRPAEALSATTSAIVNR